MSSAKRIEGVLVGAVVGSFVLTLSGSARASLQPGVASREAAHLTLSRASLPVTAEGVLGWRTPIEEPATAVHGNPRLAPSAIGGTAPSGPSRASREVSPTPRSDSATATTRVSRGEQPLTEVGSVMSMSDQFRQAIRDWRGR